MDDLLERLRDTRFIGQEAMRLSAADEIERLRAENANLRRWKALDKPITAAMEIANSHMARMRALAERVCWFDWSSNNDADAVRAVDDLRRHLEQKGDGR